MKAQTLATGHVQRNGQTASYLRIMKKNNTLWAVVADRETALSPSHPVRGFPILLKEFNAQADIASRSIPFCPNQSYRAVGAGVGASANGKAVESA